jgi:molybdopterin-containing oxidoreductase family iron-sulfur binding subunit
MESPVLFLTRALISPTQKALLYDLKLALPGLHHAAFEPAAPQPAIAASTALFGKAIIPGVRLDRADVVLSLQSDFLGTDPNAPAFTRDFSRRRGVSGRDSGMNRLWVLEGSMTLTGANADQRLQARPSALAGVAFALARLLNRKHALPLPEGLTPGDLEPFEPQRAAQAAGIDSAALRLLADNLAHAGKSALVLAGPALPPQAHVACQLLNSMLGAEENTLDFAGAPPPPELIGFSELQSLLQKAAQGEFTVAIFWGTNPAYAFPEPSLWKKAVAKIPETYRIGLYEDETALDCAWRLPEHHWLESWGDFEPASDYASLRQPVSGPIHDTMQAEEFLLSCLRRMKVRTRPSYLDYLKSRWQSDVFPAGSPVPFESFWNAALHDGGVRREPRQPPPLVPNAAALKDAIREASGPEASGELELVLSPAYGVYDGRYANNGWLIELPDPVTKSDWGNPVLLSISDAERLGLKQEDVVRISSGNATVEAPVIVQPGQSPGVAALALGYGRRTGSVAVEVGVNAYPLIDVSSKSPHLLTEVKISRSGERRKIPKTQVHDRMEGRQPARSLTLADYSHKGHQGEKHEKQEPHHTASLIPELNFQQYKWGMAIDLSVCTGCSACVVACQSENNVPVVGPERILEGRHMQWIRIDRYYEGDPRSPSVLHQPMLCQHCDNAPCEIVCPVNATTHSPDGLNQMAYNRCVGTRYCSNNCPFKVRRFNFFDYTSMKKEPENLVYNPEVTVRPRGVMEKCTFCVQRIQDARQIANSESREVRDGEIQPACAAACPAGAIVFGDLNDPESRVAKTTKMDRHYRLLEELGIKPSVTYLADISNPAIMKDKA